MEGLYTLLQLLNEKERKHTRNYLGALPLRAEARSRMQTLFQVMLKSKGMPSVESCSKKVFGRKDASALGKLKRQLRSCVYDSLICYSGLKRTDELSETNQAIIEIKKKSALFTQLFYSRSSAPLAAKLLEEIIEASLENEYYNGAIEHLRFRKWMKGLRQGFDAFNSNTKEIEFYENCAQALNRAVDNYYTVVMMNNETSHLNKSEVNEFLEKAIAEASVDAETTRSQTVRYYLNWLRLSYYNLNGAFAEAKKVCEDMLRLLRRNPFLQRNERFSFAYGNLANCNVYLGLYPEAAKFAIRSLEHLEKHSLNTGVSLETEFLAYLYGGELKKAEKIIAQLLRADISRESEFDNARRLFYKASLCFAQGKTEQCRDLLLRPLKVMRDKTGWQLGIRSLLLLCYVELGKPDLAMETLANLKRFAERCKQNGESISPRDTLILQLFKALDKCGFNFNRLGDKGLQVLQKLQSTSGPLSWQPFTSELVKVHEWVISKRKNRV